MNFKLVTCKWAVCVLIESRIEFSNEYFQLQRILVIKSVITNEAKAMRGTMYYNPQNI